MHINYVRRLTLVLRDGGSSYVELIPNPQLTAGAFSGLDLALLLSAPRAHAYGQTLKIRRADAFV
jgi:hypothetical protein